MAEPDDLIADVETALANHSWVGWAPYLGTALGELVDVIAPVVREFDERTRWIAEDTRASRTADADGRLG
jgi:hypothetical protein